MVSHHIYKYNMVNKKATIEESIIEQEGDFVVVKNISILQVLVWLWAFWFFENHLILDYILV